MSPSERDRHSSALLLLALAAAASYANSFAAPFLFDDPEPDARFDFSTRPLVWGSFLLNRALSGASTWSYHVFNLLVHLGCGLLLYGLVRRTIARVAPRLAARTAGDLSLVTALVWLCHPLQTESVTYLSQRAESLGAFFTLACLLAFVRSAESARPIRWQALSVLAVAAGLAAKETVAVAPLLVLLYDALFLAPGPIAALRLRPRFYGLLALATLASGLAFVVPALVGDRSMGLAFEGFGALEYARTQPGVILHYLRLAFWPAPLVFDYGWPLAERAGDFVPQALVLALLGLATLVLLARRSWIGYAGTWFFAILAPSSSVVPIKDLAFEHRVYLPLAAVALLAVVGGWWLCARFLPRAAWLRPALAGALVVALAAATVRRNHDYRSEVELWRTVIQRAPRNPRGYSNLATALKESAPADPARAQEALELLLRAIEIDPDYAPAHHKLGNSYLARGEPERAASAFERALALGDSASSRAGLGVALFRLGRFAEAERHFARAIELEPDDPEHHQGRANALARLERADEAIAEYEQVLRLAPEHQDAHGNLGALLLARGEPQAALPHFRRALEIGTSTAEEHFNLGQCLAALASFAEARAAFREAMRLAPELAEPRAALAKTLCSAPDAGAEERAEALRLAEAAREMTGGSRADVLETLALVLAANGEHARAVECLEQALALPGPTRNAAFRERLLAQQQRYRDDAGR